MSKLKAVDPKTASPKKPKILIFGKAGVGKTWTSLDFPKCYYIDTEGGANLSHYTDKLKKSGGVYFGPEQGADDFETVIEQVEALATEKHDYKTVIIDSVSKIFGAEITKEADRLGDKDGFGASKRPAISLTRKLIRWIDRIDMNVILIAHEKASWYKGEQIGVSADAYEKLDYELDLCLNIKKTGDTRKAFVTKSRLEQFPDGNAFEWSYAEFSKLYGKEVMEKESVPVVLANKQQLDKVKELLETIKLGSSIKDRWIEKNLENLHEVESDKMDDIIKHLTSKKEK